MVVDGEDGLRTVEVAFLEDLGYKTVAVGDEALALNVLEENSQIDLLFSDVVVLGDFDGHRSGEAAQIGHPELKMLLTSGFAAKREKAIKGGSKLFASLARNLLDKPYNQHVLAVAIRRQLDAKG